MTIRFLGMSDEERLTWEQETGVTTQAAVRIVEESIRETETIINTALREVQEIVGPHGRVSRVQAGPVQIARNGILVRTDGVEKTVIDSEGNFFVGSDTTDAAYTSFSVFVQDQIYNNEDMGAGDLLIGDNSEGVGNVKYDASEGQLQFRGGQTVQAYMDTDGSIVAGEGNVRIDAGGITFANGESNQYFVFLDSNGDPTMYIVSTVDDALAITNNTAGRAIRIYVKQTDGEQRLFEFVEDADNDNVAQFNIGIAEGAAKISMGTSVVIWSGKDGEETVFNNDSFDINHRIESATNANAFLLDAGAEAVHFFGTTGGTSVATVDGGTDKRLEIGADHYFPTRDSANPNGFWNEANQDMDFTFEGDNSSGVLKIDAGLDSAQLGSRVQLTGVITETLSADVDDWEPTNIATSSIIRIDAADLVAITGIAAGPAGEIKILFNIGVQRVTLSDEDTNSAEANRFDLGFPVTIFPGKAVPIFYDGTTARWRVVSVDFGFDDAEGDPEDIGTAADGTSRYAARRDHVHGGPAIATNSNDIFRCNSCAASLFTGTINGTPSGTSVVYTPVSGNENVLVPASTSQLAKMRLYNTTRGNSALISNTNTGTNTITLTATVPANWANGDALTTASQTVSGGGFNWIDLEVTSGDFVGKSLVFLYLAMIDSGGAGQALVPHPFETFGAGKLTATAHTQSTQPAINTHPYKLNGNIITVSWSASGAATATPIIRQSMYIY